MQPYQISKMIDRALQAVRRISSENLLEMKEMDERRSISMNLYIIMGTAAYFGKPEMFQFIACRTVQLTMKYGVCKHSIMGLVHFAVVLGCNNKSKQGVEIATRIGKAAISCSRERYRSSEHLANLYYAYYGIIAPHTEPIQTCADMLRQGFDAGMSLGDSDIAFFNSINHIRTLIMAGERLRTLSENVNYYLKMANAYKNSIARAFFSLYRDTVTILTGNGEISSLTDHSNDLPTNNTNGEVLVAILFQRAIQAYWLGHIKRCQFYTEKFFQNATFVSLGQPYFILFIYGLSSFELQKRKTSIKLKTIASKSIRVLKTSASFSSWNSQNKVSTATFAIVSCTLLTHDRQPVQSNYPIDPSLRG
jgi:hypothetical protein